MNKIGFRFFAVPILSLFLFAGCFGGGGGGLGDIGGSGGGDDGGGGVGGVDTTPPTVISFTPSSGATGVQTDVVITATFSEEMDASTFNTTTFIVTGLAGPVSGTVSYSDSDKTAKFTPAAPLALLTPYNATITTGAKDKAGNALSENFSWSFTIREGSFVAAPIPLVTVAAGAAVGPQVVVDGSSNAIAVWEQVDDATGIHHIFANRFEPAEGWGTAALIEADNVGDALAPRIAMDENGNAIAVWTESDGQRNDIFANHFRPGGGWGTPIFIERDATGQVFNPHVAMDADGNAIAVWEQSDGATLNIMANHFDSNSGWGDVPVVLFANTTGFSSEPRIALDKIGNAIAVWEQWEPVDALNFNVNIMASRFVKETSFEAGALINVGPGDAFLPQVAMDLSGNAIAVWQQFDGTQDNIVANRFISGAGWGTSSPIEAGAGDAQDPRVAMDDIGNAIAVWHQVDDIIANRFNINDGVWGTAAAIEGGPGAASAPQIALDANGHAVAAWHQLDGAIVHVRVNRFVAGQGWGTDVMLDTGVIEATDPDIAVGKDSTAVAVWIQFDGTVDTVATTRFQ